MTSFSQIIKAAGFCWFLLVTASASAGGFSVAPVRVFLKDVPQVVMTVGNASESEIYIQTELMAWTQHDEKDVYTTSREVLVSPPMFKIPAGGEQTVRVRLMGETAVSQERTFRLFLQEVPQVKADQAEVSTTLKVGVPIFIQPTKADSANYEWQAIRSAEGITLKVKNTTNSHIQITGLKLSDSGGKLIKEENVFAYVLADRSFHWDIKLEQPWRGDKFLLQATSDRGDIKTTVELSTPITVAP
ncbi:MAG: fimbria/pilus periplasmic chaperone [Gallionella sp.]|nr:molecular chaperone [Gallionella sp.]